jgi:hypothetical protein
MSLVPTEIDRVQAGDQIVVDSKVWTIKALEGPDRIGTYDLFLQDDHGAPKIAVANGFVTMVR